MISSAVTREELMTLSTEELEGLAWRVRWLEQAKKNTNHAGVVYQLPPEELAWWTIYFLNAGRGAGKTRAAAEDTAWYAWQNPRVRCLVCAPTSEDVLTVCFEGESGLLSCIPRPLIKSYTMKPPEIMLINDSMLHGIPASEPDRLRGPQWHRVWAEEVSSWQYAQEAFDMIMFALRLGKHPRMVLTTTPKPQPLIRALAKRNGKDVMMVNASTYNNMGNLAPTFRDQVLRYENTQLGRQEIHAEILDPEEQGIIKRSWIRMWPASKQLPWFDYIVMSLDTALTEETRDDQTGDPDYTACQVWGLFFHEKRANAMMLDAWQARLGLPDLLKRVKEELKSEYGQLETPILKPLIGPAHVALETKKIDLVLVERQGAGRPLLQFLSRQGVNGYEYNPGRMKKLDRLHLVSYLFSQGVVWMTEGRRFDKQSGTYVETGEFSSWAQPVIDQICTFSGEGSIPHDDHVDAGSQALRLLSDRNMLDTIRHKPEETAPLVTNEQRQNPYGV